MIVHSNLTGEEMKIASMMFIAIGLLTTSAKAQSEKGNSKTPPVGPPWVTDFAEARSLAIQSGKPIFLYSTKTYCPHCVIMERELLSNTELSSSYDDVIWMYLFQDFSHSEADRAAERVAIRFGISSWPQHFLIDPKNLKVIGDTQRRLKTFRAAVASVKLGDSAVVPSLRALTEADHLAEQLEVKQDAEQALALLGHEDVVVRYRAIEILADKKPEEIVKRAGPLLAVEHDQTRYAVCAVLAEFGDESTAPALEAIVRDPGKSRNPNVARIRAVQALASCGTAESLKVVRSHAASGVYFNGLTGVSIDTVLAIAKRHPESEKAARVILKDAFPILPTNDKPERDKTACTRLAQRVNEALCKLTGETIDFPDEYTNQSREALINRW